jgi:hypothetical protein
LAQFGGGDGGSLSAGVDLVRRNVVGAQRGIARRLPRRRELVSVINGRLAAVRDSHGPAPNTIAHWQLFSLSQADSGELVIVAAAPATAAARCELVQQVRSLCATAARGRVRTRRPASGKGRRGASGRSASSCLQLAAVMRRPIASRRPLVTLAALVCNLDMSMGMS